MTEKAISRIWAEWVEKLRFENLDKDTIYHAKRILFDAMGCALGGHRAEDCEISLHVIEQMGGTPEATLIATGFRTNAYMAALANALMIRVMDFNDIYWKDDPSHPSDIIPAALSVGERQGKSGSDLLLGVVIGHELEMRLCEFPKPGIRERGWHHASLTQLVSPLVAGKMLDLNPDQLTNSVGISGCHNFSLGAVAAGKLTMMKNTVDPMATQSGVLAALLAQKGYIGTELIFEGKEGFCRQMGEGYDFDALTKGLGNGFKIKDCSYKAFPTEFLTQSPVTAALKLVKDKDIKWQDVEEVTVHTIHRAVDILADPSKYHPTSKETADHSMPYCVGAAIMDRMITPLQFKPEKIANKELIDLIQKIKVVADDNLEKEFPKLQPSVVDIQIKSGQKFTQRVDYAKGDPREPMTDSDLKDKFYGLTADFMGDEQRAKIQDMIFNMEEVDSIEEFMQTMIVKK
jgi:2-methylcitrate dehydratase